MIVADGLVRQIDGEGVGTVGFGTLEEFVDVGFLEDRRQNAILETVVVKNVGVTGREDHAEPVITYGPGSVFAAGAAAKVRASKQNRRALVFRKIQNELRIWFFTRKIAPVVKKNPTEAFACQRLQELLWHHLVGIHIDAIERQYQASVGDKWLHYDLLHMCDIKLAYIHKVSCNGSGCRHDRADQVG